MACRVRKTQGANFGDCSIVILGTTRKNIYAWCGDCGIMIQEPVEQGKRKIFIPKFDPQTGGPS